MGSAKAKLVLSLAAVAWAVAGCNCNQPQAERKLTVAITDPTEGATFNVGASVRVVVEAKAESSAGGVSDFVPAGGTLQVDGVDTPVTPLLETGKITFIVVAPAGAHQLQVVGVTEVGTSFAPVSTGVVNITVSKDVTPPQVTAVSFEGDANHDNKLNLAELPLNTKVVVLVEVNGLEDGQPVVVQAAPPATTVYGQANAAAGKASITLDQLPGTLEASYSLAVLATDQAGNSNTPGPAPLNDKALATLKVDQVPPTVTVLAPTKTLFGPPDDADPAAAGFQFRVTATSPEADVTQVTLSVDGKGATCAAGSCISAGSAVMTLLLTTPGTRSGPMIVTAADDSGNTATVAKQVTFDFDPPVVAITSPLASANPHTQFTQALSATVTDPNGGSALGQMVTFYRVTPPATVEVPIGQAAVDAGGNATTQASFQNGTYNIVARVSDLAGNPSAPAVEAGVVVNAAGCDVLITAPANKPAFLTKSDDLDPITADLQYVIAAHSVACPSTVITLYRDGGNPRPMVTDASGNASWPVTIPNGTFTFRVDINNLSGPPTQDSVSVTVDLTTPSITQPMTGTVLNVSSDLDRRTAGVQRQMSYAATVPAGGRVDLCSNQSPAPSGAVACADGAAGWWVLKASAQPTEATFTFPDGAYSIKPVVVGGTATNVGSAIALVVDGVRPTTSSVVIVGDANGDGRLNIAELAGGNPKVTVVTSEPCTVFVRDHNTAAVYSSTVATGVGSSVTLDLNLTAPEADYVLDVVLRDLHANYNVVSGATVDDPLDAKAIFNLRVDRVAPTCLFTAPSKSQYGVADDADPVALGYQLRAGTSTSTDVGTNGITVNLTGAMTQSASVTPAGGQATHDFTVLGSGTNVYSFAATCTDQSGNSATATPVNNVTVDLDVPTCNLTDPVNTTVYGTFAINTSATVGGPGTVGLTVSVYTTPSGGSKTPVGSLAVPTGGVASGSLTYPNGAQAVVAEVTDLAGNKCTSNVANITVNAVGCSITLATPTSNGFLNKSSGTVTGTPPTLTFNVTGSSAACANKTVKIYRLSPQTLLSSGNTDASSNFSIPVAIGEGVFSFMAEIDNGSGVLTTTTASNVTVDLTDPGVGTVWPTGANLYFVAQGNVNVPSNPAYVPDGTPGAPADVVVSISNVTGAVGGSVQVVYGATVVGGPSQVTADPQSFSIPVTMAQRTTGTFAIEVRDQAGNVVRPTNAAAVVNVIAPGSPTVVQTLMNARAAIISLSWGAVYDDGSSAASGPVTGYDVRWTYNAIKTATGTQTSGMAAADYFDPGKVRAETVLGPSTLSYNLAVPPLGTYYIAVRAKDGVGNYSDFVVPTAISDPLTKATLVNPSGVGGEYFGYVTASGGSLNNDSVPDLVVAAPLASNGGVASGAVYLYFGSVGFTNQAACNAPDCQKLAAYDSTTVTNRFGYDLSVGNAGDLASEGKPDVLVAAPDWSSYAGRAFLFFGSGTQASLDPTAFVEFRGNAGSALATAARILPDIDNPPDGYGEVALSAHSELSGQGRIYIFKGRSRAAWTALATGVDGASGRNYVPMSAADVVIEGPLPVNNATFLAGNQFGLRPGGYTALGDIDGDGRQDFTVPDSKDTVGKLFLFTGAKVASSALLKTGDTPTPNDALQTLTATPTAVGNRFGFGAFAVGNVDVIGATLKDLIVSQPTAATVRLFADGTATGFSATANATITGATGSYFGNGMAVADWSGDTKADLAVSEGLGSSNSLWLFFSRAGGFDSTAGSGFWQARLQGPATSSLGKNVVAADLNNDGAPDLAASDDLDSPGKVIVWH